MFYAYFMHDQVPRLLKILCKTWVCLDYLRETNSSVFSINDHAVTQKKQMSYI